MKRFLVIVGILFVGTALYADNQTWGRTKNGAAYTTNEGALQISSMTLLGNQSCTVVISTPTSVTYTGTADTYNYITDIHIEQYSTGTIVGTGAPVNCTTTNFPGNPSFMFPSALTANTINFYNIDYVFPLRSTTVGAQNTIVCPAKPGYIWNIIVNYYTDD